MAIKPIDILNNWVKFVGDRDVNSLCGLYNDHAVLIPTFTNKILDTPSLIKNYFENLGKKENLDLVLNTKTVVEQPVVDQVFLIHGIYSWVFFADNEMRNIEARFTFVLDMSLSSQILQHHSSQVPHML